MHKPVLIFLLFSLSLQAQDFVGESVEYDPVGNRFFTSSDGVSIQQRAGDGTLSYFGQNLSAQLGMEVMNGVLFTLSGSMLNAYDLSTEQALYAINFGSAQFLNGLTNDGVDRLWATDFGGRQIVEYNVSDLDNPEAIVVVDDTGLTPNGIMYDEENNRLVFVTWSGGLIRAVDLADYSVSDVIDTGLENMDGIDRDSDGNYYVSSWNPQRITKFDATFSESEIIEVDGLFNGADICVAAEIDTLAIPSTSQSVIFVDLGEETIPAGTVLTPPPFEIYPNPTSDYLHLGLSDFNDWEISLHAIDGKYLRRITAPRTSVEDLSRGYYFLTFQHPEGSYRYTFVKN